jgi:hypothetical protein
MQWNLFTSSVIKEDFEYSPIFIKIYVYVSDYIMTHGLQSMAVYNTLL